jgi:hypothetical protein
MTPILIVNTITFLLLAVIWGNSSGFNLFLKFLFWGLTLVNGVTLAHVLGFVVKS